MGEVSVIIDLLLRNIYAIGLSEGKLGVVLQTKRVLLILVVYFVLSSWLLDIVWELLLGSLLALLRVEGVEMLHQVDLGIEFLLYFGLRLEVELVSPIEDFVFVFLMKLGRLDEVQFILLLFLMFLGSPHQLLLNVLFQIFVYRNRSQGLGLILISIAFQFPQLRHLALILIIDFIGRLGEFEAWDFTF